MLIALEDGARKGAARSIEAFHLYDALAACSGHLARFGGHRHAAGVTVERARVEAFRMAFEAHAATHLAEDDLVPRCRIDGWLEERDVNERAAEDLARLGPFGAGYPEPVFALRAAAPRAPAPSGRGTRTSSSRSGAASTRSGSGWATGSPRARGAGRGGVHAGVRRVGRCAPAAAQAPRRAPVHRARGGVRPGA